MTTAVTPPPFDAMVLCAGLGTRLRPLTLEVAKPAVPFFGRALATWCFDRLAALGARRVVINTHWLPETMVAPARREAARLGLELLVSHEPELLGTGGGLRQARSRFDLARDRPLLVLNGDVLFDVDLASTLDAHARTGADATLVLRTPPPGATYGAVYVDPTSRLTRLRNHTSPRYDGTQRQAMFSGVHVLSAAILDRLPEGESDVVTAAYAGALADDRRLHGVFEDGLWLDLGDAAGYLDAHLAFLDGRLEPAVAARLGLADAVARPVSPDAVLGGGATLTACVVGPGAKVGAGARLSECVLWPGAVVQDGETLHRTIVTPERRVEVR